MFQNSTFRTMVIPDFYPHAHEMRQKYDAFFADPAHATYDNFRVNFWHVPTCYTYMRVHSKDILGQALHNDFHNYLATFARELGYPNVSGSFISIYVAGMYQTCHSDMLNGSLGWVFSLTHWDKRTFAGGSTQVARQDVFDRLEPREPRGHDKYWEDYPAHFNQLLLFDDRLAHQVPVIQGQMDPLEARVVTHGHLY